MPTRSTARGRGRGRGRGGTARGAAAAASSRDIVQSSEAANPSLVTTAGTAAPAEPSQPAPAAATTAAPEPSPATITNTSATASTRLPSTTPAPTSSSRGSASTSKFKPKGVRRSEAERARIAEEQQRIQEQKNAEEARRLARVNRGRGRARGRGRGGFLQGNLRTSAAAGPLAAGMSLGRGGGPSGYRGTGGYAFASGSGSGTVKGEGEGKGEKGVYGSSGLVDNNRINADMLYNYVEISDEEDKASVTSTAQKKKAIMPMGIRRVEHKEDEVTMTTAAEIEAQEKAGGVSEEESDEEGLFVEGAAAEDFAEGPTDERVWELGVRRSSRKVKIKKEEGEGGDTDLDEIGQGVKAPESPELKKAALAGEPKPKKPATLKDLADEIREQDLRRMLNLFTLQSDDAVAEDGTAHNAALDGHMFLFQFPPVLPPLRAVPPDATSPNTVKPEPEDDDDDVVMLTQPQQGGGPVNIDLTQDADKVKNEGDDEEAEEGHGDEGGDELREGGFLGNMIVRKSGKVEMSWGGLALDMMPGIQYSFLSTAALIEEADVKPGDGNNQMAGVAYGMGKIQGSFALAPIWGEEEDWVVDPADLVVPEE